MGMMKEVPLTLEQLMQVRPERPILVKVRCLDERTGEPDQEDEDFEIWDGRCFANADTYDTLENYGKRFLAYLYMERLTMIDGMGNEELVRCMSCSLEKAGENLENCGYCEEGWQRALKKLHAIENILGDDYDLDRLRELVEADRAGENSTTEKGEN